MAVRDRSLSRADLQQHRHQPLCDRVVHLARHPVALRRGGLRAGLGFRGLVQTGVRDRDRGVLGEQLEQLRILVDELAIGVAREHHARADDGPPPPDGNADHALELFPVLRPNVPARHIAVVLEDHRPSTSHDRAGRAFREREHLAGLAGDADVRLLAIDARRLVNEADRPGVAAQKLRGTPEDPLEQWAERQLPCQILHHGGQRLGPCPLARHHDACEPPFIVRSPTTPMSVRGGMPAGQPYGLSEDRAIGRSGEADVHVARSSRRSIGVSRCGAGPAPRSGSSRSAA